MIELFFILISFTILGSAFLISFFLSKIFNNPLPGNSKNLSFSILVPFRNESKNLKNLIDSLNNLNYNKSHFQVILIDDHSSDNSFHLVKDLISGLPNFSLVQNTNHHSLGKKGALSFGIQHAAFPYILITDADCVVEKEWLNAFANKFSEGYEFVFGLAPFFFKKSFLNHLICFENLRMFLLYFLSNQINLTYGAAARSFGFSLPAFQKIGGYSKTFVTASGDDDLLLKEAVAHNLSIGAFAYNNSNVYSSAKSTLKDYLKQKNRHIKTSFHYTLKLQFIIALWHFVNLFLLFSPVLTFISPYFYLLFLSKIIADLFLAVKFQHRFNYSFSFLGIVVHQIFYELLVIVNFFNSLLFKSSWK